MRNRKREKKATCCLSIWISVADLQRLKEQAARSTCGSFSEFARRLLLGRRATILYRNHSMDSFLDEAILLRNEMTKVRQSGPWMAANEERMIALMEGIQSMIIKIYEQCKPT